MAQKIPPALLQRYTDHARRNRDLSTDPALGLQAENFMLRLEKKSTYQKAPGKCAGCGKKISLARLKALPETAWCKKCAEAYEEKRGKPWTKKIKSKMKS